MVIDKEYLITKLKPVADDFESTSCDKCVLFECCECMREAMCNYINDILDYIEENK